MGIARIRLTLAFALLVGPAMPAAMADARCDDVQFRIESNFESGQFDKCKIGRDGLFEITIRPEDRRVTVEQPWFAFRVTPQSGAANEVKIRLRFPGAYARYWPKLSTDGQTWSRAPETAVIVSKNGREMEITLPVVETGLWVAAQELLSIAWYEDWMAELGARSDVVTAVIGQSVEGRPIRLAKTTDRPEAILLLGRQHPAEVPGAIAMREFVDVILGDTELARQFRQRYTLIILPLMNPDGVYNGHWRHNAGRTDLNRDWGIFKQPETRAVAKLLGGIEKFGMKLRLMLDFHATRFTDTAMFYTQTAEEVTDPAAFAVNWLGAVRERLPDYGFKHDPRPSQDNPNTKGFFYRRFGIPAITYEIGDEADRDLLRETTPVFAEEMMRAMLRAD